ESPHSARTQRGPGRSRPQENPNLPPPMRREKHPASTYIQPLHLERVEGHRGYRQNPPSLRLEAEACRRKTTPPPLSPSPPQDETISSPARRQRRCCLRPPLLL